MKFSFSADSVGCAAGRSSGVVLGGQGLFCYFVFEFVPKWPHKNDDNDVGSAIKTRNLFRLAARFGYAGWHAFLVDS